MPGWQIHSPEAPGPLKADCALVPARCARECVSVSEASWEDAPGGGGGALRGNRMALGMGGGF